MAHTIKLPPSSTLLSKPFFSFNSMKFPWKKIEKYFPFLFTFQPARNALINSFKSYKYYDEYFAIFYTNCLIKNIHTLKDLFSIV